jgi:hypothetical protein
MSVWAFNFHSHVFVFRKGRVFIFNTLQTTQQFRCCLWTSKSVVVSDTAYMWHEWNYRNMKR